MVIKKWNRGRNRTRLLVLISTWMLLLVGVAFLASEDVGDGFEDDLEVEEKAPVL